MDTTQDSPKIIPAIAVAFSALVAYAVVFFLAMVVIAALFLLFSKIPILSSLLGIFFAFRGDTPVALTVILSTVLSYEAAAFTSSRFTTSPKTAALSRILSGVFLLALNGIFLVVNISSGSAFFSNAANAISGIVMIVKGKESL
ncbi:MAG: hypothetical protein SOZ90_04345 [Candidatus Faecousia sp.]|nr:hypothetical protein [Candidatus Faecousia sp.]